MASTREAGTADVRRNTQFVAPIFGRERTLCKNFASKTYESFGGRSTQRPPPHPTPNGKNHVRPLARGGMVGTAGRAPARALLPRAQAAWLGAGASPRHSGCTHPQHRSPFSPDVCRPRVGHTSSFAPCSRARNPTAIVPNSSLQAPFHYDRSPPSPVRRSRRGMGLSRSTVCFCNSFRVLPLSARW